MTILYYVRERSDGQYVAHVVGAFAAARVVTICGGDWTRGAANNGDLLHAGRPEGTTLCAGCAEQIAVLAAALRGGAPDEGEPSGRPGR